MSTGIDSSVQGVWPVSCHLSEVEPGGAVDKVDRFEKGQLKDPGLAAVGRAVDVVRAAVDLQHAIEATEDRAGRSALGRVARRQVVKLHLRPRSSAILGHRDHLYTCRWRITE